MIQSYLSNRKQIIKTNNAYSSWEEILFGVLQGSILGPLLFNIFIGDLVSIMNSVNFVSYADDNTPYIIGDTVIQVTESLKEETSDEFTCWFANNQRKANPGKCHLITSSNDEVSMYVENCNIKSSKCEKHISIKIENKLNFNNHIDKIWKNAGQKLDMLSRVTPTWTYRNGVCC